MDQGGNEQGRQHRATTPARRSAQGGAADRGGHERARHHRAATPDLVGEQVGNYRLTRRLGEGGMGVVYEAVHPVLGRRVAVKILKLDAQAQRAGHTVERFFTEARVVASLGHEHIVEAYDFGAVQLGEHQSYYVIMELLEGQSLRAALHEGPLAVARVVALGRQAAAALGAAHDRGIIHRDVKPDNLFLARAADGSEVLKILDFGIAKLFGDVTPGRRKITRAGVLLGTPSFMSPEQCLGRAVDPRSDIYSLGLVLYQAATGQRPFGRRPEPEILAAQVREAPPAPTALRPDLPLALEAVLLRALAKRPEHRFASMADLGAALARLADGDAPEPTSEELAGLREGCVPTQVLPSRDEELTPTPRFGVLGDPHAVTRTMDRPPGRAPADEAAPEPVSGARDELGWRAPEVELNELGWRAPEVELNELGRHARGAARDELGWHAPEVVRDDLGGMASGDERGRSAAEVHDTEEESESEAVPTNPLGPVARGMVPDPDTVAAPPPRAVPRGLVAVVLGVAALAVAAGVWLWARSTRPPAAGDEAVLASGRPAVAPRPRPQPGVGQGATPRLAASDRRVAQEKVTATAASAASRPDGGSGSAARAASGAASARAAADDRRVAEEQPGATRQRRAHLTVKVSPWAKVYLDGRYLGETPLTRRVRPGTHRLLLVNEGLRKREQMPLRLAPGARRTVWRRWPAAR